MVGLDQGGSQGAGRSEQILKGELLLLVVGVRGGKGSRMTVQFLSVCGKMVGQRVVVVALGVRRGPCLS